MADNKFYSDADVARIDRYNKMQALQDGKFMSQVVQKGGGTGIVQQVLRRMGMKKPGPMDIERLVLNFPGFVSTTFSDLLFLEPPSITSTSDNEKENAWLGELSGRNNFDCSLWESAYSDSALGDEFWKIRLEEGNDMPVIESQDPRNVVPRFDPLNERTVRQFDVIVSTEETKSQKTIAVVEEHLKGRIEYKIMILGQDGRVLDREKPSGFKNRLSETKYNYQDTVDTGIEDFLILHVPNKRKSRRYWGMSDYDGHQTVLEEINHRVSKLAVALDIMADPKFQGPEDYVGPDGHFSYSGPKYFGTTEGEVPITPIVWDPRAAQQIDHIGKLIEIALGLTEIWGGLFMTDKFGQAESGRALKLRMMRTLWATKRKRKFFGQAIKEAARIAQELAAANGRKLGFEPARPQIEWSDVLPFDRLEATDEQSRKINQNLVSRETALRSLNPKWTEDEVAAELARIAEDIEEETPEFLRDIQRAKGEADIRRVEASAASLEGLAARRTVEQKILERGGEMPKVKGTKQ